LENLRDYSLSRIKKWYLSTSIHLPRGSGKALDKVIKKMGKKRKKERRRSQISDRLERELVNGRETLVCKMKKSKEGEGDMSLEEGSEGKGRKNTLRMKTF